MTTIACNLREMAADSRVTWEGVGSDAFSAVKLFSGNGCIYGVTGDDCTGSLNAMEWLTGARAPEDRPYPPEYEHGWDWRLIELSKRGIAIYNVLLERELCTEGLLAVGSGRKVALYCMKYLRMTPAEAVREACKVDHHSEVPIYHARLSDGQVRRWSTERTPRRSARPEAPTAG